VAGRKNIVALLALLSLALAGNAGAADRALKLSLIQNGLPVATTVVPLTIGEESAFTLWDRDLAADVVAVAPCVPWWQPSDPASTKARRDVSQGALPVGKGRTAVVVHSCLPERDARNLAAHVGVKGSVKLSKSKRGASESVRYVLAIAMSYTTVIDQANVTGKNGDVELVELDVRSYAASEMFGSSGVLSYPLPASRNLAYRSLEIVETALPPAPEPEKPAAKGKTPEKPKPAGRAPRAGPEAQPRPQG
jgi:hypothetical protein